MELGNLTQQDIQTPSHFTNEEILTTVTNSNNSNNNTTKFFTDTSKSHNSKTLKRNLTTGNDTIYG